MGDILWAQKITTQLELRASFKKLRD